MNAARSIVIDGVEIPERLIAREAQNHPGADAAQAWREAGHALAVKALLLHRAHALGLEAEPERDETGRQETDDEALIRALLDAEIEVSAPSDAECRRVYETQSERFRTPALFEASHILIEPGGASDEAGEAARAIAQGAIDALMREPGRFAETARALSACTSAQLGGSLGQLRVGDLAPEVERALLELAPGSIGAAPARSRFGWHVLRLDRRIEGRMLPFEFVAESIRLHLESRAWVAAAGRYAGKLGQDLRARGITLSVADEGEVVEGSLALGDFLGERAAAHVEEWLGEADPELAAAVGEAARAQGVGVAAFVRSAAVDFVDSADDERWTQLISAAQGAEDPAFAAVAAIMKSKLTPAPRRVTLIRNA